MKSISLGVALILLASVVSAQGAPACTARPPEGSASPRLYRDGSALCWNGKPLRMSGYYTTDLATRDGYDFSRFLNTIRYVNDANPSKRHGVNFTRVWATGTSNSPDCYHTPNQQDTDQPPMTMPFQLMPGETCSARDPFPKYNMCISGVACEQSVGFNPTYQTRLQAILAEARNNGIIVALVLFDAYFMGRHQDSEALYATNPWNPLNNNMEENKFRRSPGSASLVACNRLYKSTDASDITKDAFPEFYDICSDVTSTDRCNKSLNCLGLIEKSYVETMVDLVRNTRGGSDHVFFEIMNRSRFDKRDSRKEGFNLAKFKRWNDVVGYWIKCRGDNDCRNTRGDFLVLAEVGLADFSDLACTNRATCPNNPLDALAMPNIDVLNFQGHTWNNSAGARGPCETAKIALSKFKKPVIIDTDAAVERISKCKVEKWAAEIKSCGSIGQVHFNQLDGMTFGYTPPKECTFTGTGNQQIFMDFDERYLDCHSLDTIGATDPTYLSDIVTTAVPQGCPHSVSSEGKPKWCSNTCKQK